MATCTSVPAAPVVCLGCGEVTRRSSDRRNLKSSASQHVLPLWRTTIVAELQKRNQLITPDSLISGSLTAHGSGHMCRKCFYAYEKVQKAKAIIESNAAKALDTLIPCTSSATGDCDLHTGAKHSLSSASTIALPPPKRHHPPPIFATPAPGKTQSPDVAIHLGYKKPQTYILTPSRKHIGKAVARRSRHTIALECLKEPVTRKYILKRIGVEARNELKSMCSDATDSILHKKCMAELRVFSWDKLITELQANAPVFLSILCECTHTRRPRQNQDAVLGMCAAILLKHRCSKMSMVQRILSLILYAGHSGKQVFARLQRVNLSMSHMTTTRLVTDLGAGHDDKVKQWQDSLTKDVVTTLAQGEQETTAASFSGVRIISSGDLSSESSTSDTDQEDIVSPSHSPITSDASHSDISSLESEPESSEESSDGDMTDVPEMHEMDTASSASSVSTCHLGYKLVGDNIDKNVKARYMRVKGSQNQSLHYFHSFAVRDRIDFSHLPNTFPDTCLNSPKKLALALLPSEDDDTALTKLFETHVSRILCTHMPFFKSTFDDVVEWHIHHEYYDQMSAKSEVVPLGVLLKNENKGDDMVDIMAHLHQYVPGTEHTEDVFVPWIGETVQLHHATYHKILLGGDQLTVARARGSQKAMDNSVTPHARIHGLIPCAEDWHTKVILLKVIWKYYYSKKSAKEHGTLYQLRNLVHRTNVTQPDKDYNACDDFFKLVITCHILTAALEFLGMDSLTSTPASSVVSNPQDVWMETEVHRREILRDICHKIVERFISFRFNKVGTRSTDLVHMYGKQLLGLGCFYLEYSNAIQEGDGNRVLRCWKYLLPIFKSSGRKNYSIEALQMLIQYHHKLTPQQSAQLIWSRFVNVHGIRGRNIPCDLHQEHLNRILKNAIRDLGVNKTEKAITRVGKALGTLSSVLQQFDEHNHVSDSTGIHRPPASDKDRDALIHQLQQSETFSRPRVRSHKSFPNPRDPLHANNSDKLYEWMIAHIT